MGYSLTIGEAYLHWEPGYCTIEAKGEKHSNAPAFGEPTDYTNSRWPSYTAWHDSMEKLDLLDFMFNEFEYEGESYPSLIEDHPGVMPITKEYLDYLKLKLDEYKSKNPTHIAKLPPPKEGAIPIIKGSLIYRDEDRDNNPIYDSALCRGEWLLYWIEWAVNNCKQPVFVNT